MLERKIFLELEAVSSMLALKNFYAHVKIDKRAREIADIEEAY